MHRLWHTVVEPVLAAARPGVIVEIGAADGRNSAHLLEYCRREGGVCHVIDPLPKFDVSAWQAEYGEALVFHQRKSLEVIEQRRIKEVMKGRELRRALKRMAKRGEELENRIAAEQPELSRRSL